ncbi:MAG: hypothetical protein JGK15_07565 [Microcoleus sp. PH2017_33_LGB_O_A]|nr:hypothetical protein [Microcoleus sp. PH2017_33_LGB_O_A]
MSLESLTPLGGEASEASEASPVSLESLTPLGGEASEAKSKAIAKMVEDYASDEDFTYGAIRSYQQEAFDWLFRKNDHINVAGHFYRFEGTHYKKCEKAPLVKRVSTYLNGYIEKVKGIEICTRANPESTNSVLAWAAQRLGVSVNEINPDGLNCANGVVKINPDGSHSLVPHDSSQLYTFVGSKYDPDINPTDCDRLLECLEPAQREIFLRTIAAALCLPTVRAKIGRIKGLLLHGDGNNGKDALRAAVACILGEGMTGKTLTDFKVYDSGRKFPLAGLENSLCNWASESASDIEIDKLQGLKQVITGDPIDIEYKGIGQWGLTPRCVFLANCNKLPTISKSSESLTSRFCVIEFRKTFKRNANARKNELEADSRFKYDADFIANNVAPALLNKLLERLPLILLEGIDYGGTEGELKPRSANHLTRFIHEQGITFSANSDSKMRVKDLWELLETWYVDNGILEFQNNIPVWDELPAGDKPCKLSQHLFARLAEIFPGIGKGRFTSDSDAGLKGQAYFTGIAVGEPKAETTDSEVVDTIPVVDSLVTVLDSPSEKVKVNKAGTGYVGVQLEIQDSLPLSPYLVNLLLGALD